MVSWNKSNFVPLKIFFREAVVQRCSVKKMFLEISQNSQENNLARISFLIKLQAPDLQLLKKSDSGTSVFMWILQNF